MLRCFLNYFKRRDRTQSYIFPLYVKKIRQTRKSKTLLKNLHLRFYEDDRDVLDYLSLYSNKNQLILNAIKFYKSNNK